MNREQQCSGGAAIDHDETGICNHQPEPAPPADDALSPTLRRLRDAILATPDLTRAEALADARELLADHARELADMVHAETVEDRVQRPASTNRSASWRRTGMMRAESLLDRYADDLDQAAGGGQ